MYVCLHVCLCIYTWNIYTIKPLASLVYIGEQIFLIDFDSFPVFKQNKI